MENTDRLILEGRKLRDELTRLVERSKTRREETTREHNPPESETPDSGKRCGN